MKKTLFLIALFCFIFAATISQAQNSKGENSLPPIDQRSGYQVDNPNPAPVVVKNTDTKLMNGFTYTYVGSFCVCDGPSWPTNPPCYTGQEAAALLFGGVPTDYVISTNPNTTDPNTITFTAMVSSWGGPAFQEVPQDYKLDVPPAGYAVPGGYNTATSAYVNDWSGYTNYVWRIDREVPVSDWAIGIGVLLILAAAVIRIRRF
jgi:hypothetical protein